MAANVEVHSDEFKVRSLGYEVSSELNVVHAESELVLIQSGSDFLVCVSIDVRVDSQRNLGCLAFNCGKVVNYFEFRNRLHVEAENVVVESEVYLLVCLSDSGEDYVAWLESSLDGSLHLVAADTIGA